ncbi:MAG: tRNA pseudouridine(55) synthase TruB [Candidatus Marinimicrobia bacterium]|nr:tRNA pseudouridine(55) synthase TruB [Candidatus Neomarinimicrobiota bacterium]
MIIAINKPVKWTSFDVVEKVRSITGEKKVGHAGTLDPFAEGVLVVGIGRESTRMLSQLSATSKDYLAELKLGEETDTLDLTGEVTDQREIPHLTASKIENVLAQFRGEIEQTPPMYSAKKIDGTRLYKLARRGEQVDRDPVAVRILALQLIDLSDDTITFSVTCSKGTYIRQLASDMANALGTAGHLTALRRTRVGNYHLDDCLSFDLLEQQWMSTAA